MQVLTEIKWIPGRALKYSSLQQPLKAIRHWMNMCGVVWNNVDKKRIDLAMKQWKHGYIAEGAETFDVVDVTRRLHAAIFQETFTPNQTRKCH